MRFESVFKRSLNIKQGDRVLIITDKKKLKIGKKIFNACKKLSPNIKLLIKPVGYYHGQEPSKRVANEMKKHSVIIAITTYSLSHTNARRRASKFGARIVTMPNFVEKMVPSLEVDTSKLLKIGREIKRILSKINKVRVVTKYGTDIMFSVKNRMIDVDAGSYCKPGSFGNLPAGEVFTSPVEGTSNGTIVINSMKDYVKSGTKIIIKNGNAVDISDKKCKLAKIFKTVRNSRNVAEFGIGTNYKAKVIGNILQDEKVAGTCHIAFGDNRSFGGKVKSKVHLDAILFKPTIWFDDKMIMKDGELLV